MIGLEVALIFHIYIYIYNDSVIHWIKALDPVTHWNKMLTQRHDLTGFRTAPRLWIHWVKMLTQRLDSVSHWVKVLTQRLDSVSHWVKAVTQRLDSVSHWVKMLTQRLDSVTHWVMTLDWYTTIRAFGFTLCYWSVYIKHSWTVFYLNIIYFLLIHIWETMTRRQ